MPYILVDESSDDEPHLVSPKADYLFIRRQRVEIAHGRGWYSERGVKLPSTVRRRVPVQYLWAALLLHHRQHMLDTDAELLTDAARADETAQLPRLSHPTKVLQLDDWWHGELDSLADGGRRVQWRHSSCWLAALWSAHPIRTTALWKPGNFAHTI